MSSFFWFFVLITPLIVFFVFAAHAAKQRRNVIIVRRGIVPLGSGPQVVYSVNHPNQPSVLIHPHYVPVHSPFNKSNQEPNHISREVYEVEQTLNHHYSQQQNQQQQQQFPPPPAYQRY